MAFILTGPSALGAKLKYELRGDYDLPSAPRVKFFLQWVEEGSRIVGWYEETNGPRIPVTGATTLNGRLFRTHKRLIRAPLVKGAQSTTIPVEIYVLREGQVPLKTRVRAQFQGLPEY